MASGASRRDERITIRVPARLRKEIERAAAHDRRSVSDWIVLALSDVITAKKEDA